VTDYSMGLYYLKYHYDTSFYEAPKKIYLPSEILNLEHIYFVALSASFLKWAFLAALTMLVLNLL
jgi:hypothetical protein